MSSNEILTEKKELSKITRTDNNKLKICCFMWYDINMESYGNVNFEINKKYCEKYGYDIIKSNERTYKTRTPHWERLPFILKHMDNYDYIVWIDADAHLYLDSAPLTNVIDVYRDKLFILSADIDEPVYDHRWAVNSGFFIMKTTPQSKKIITEWATNEELYKQRYGFSVCGKTGTYQDQGVLRLMLDKNLYGMADNSIIIPYGTLQFFPGVNPCQFPNALLEIFPEEYGLNRKPFVCHWSKFNGEDRLKKAKAYLDKITEKK